MATRTCLACLKHRVRLRRPFSDVANREVSIRAAHPRDTNTSNQQSSSQPGAASSSASAAAPETTSNDTQRITEPLRDLVVTAPPRQTGENGSNGNDQHHAASSHQLPRPSSHNLMIPRVPFSTHQVVKRLESNGVDRAVATDIMHLTRDLLVRHEQIAGRELTTRQDLEDSSYMLTAALSEVQTEAQVRSRNDGIVLRSMTASLQRDTHSISQKMNEDIAKLKSDIQLDMNQRKEETSSQLKEFDMKIMDLNSKFTILLGDIRTEVETTKWVSTRRVMVSIFIVTITIVGVYTSRPKEEQRKQPPSIEELGVRASNSDAEAEVPAGGTSSWFNWSTSNAAAGPNSRRVGEEEEN